MLTLFLCKGVSIESFEPSQAVRGDCNYSGVRIELVKRLLQPSRPHDSPDNRGQKDKSATPAKAFRRRALTESADLELIDYFNNQCVFCLLGFLLFPASRVMLSLPVI
jgi:hypothetical protein